MAYTCLYNGLSTDYDYQQIVDLIYVPIHTEKTVNESLCDTNETVNIMCITIMCLVNTYLAKMKYLKINN